MAKFLPNVFISGVHGKKYEVLVGDRMTTIIPMYHPAASLRNGNILEAEKTDFVNLKTILAEIFKPISVKVEVEQPSLI